MRIKDVLWELEVASRPKHAEKTEMPSGLWTEHVLPQSWNAEWPFEDGEFVERWSADPRTSARNALAQSLGNLTLLTSGLNISSGNSGFLAKREKYEEHSALFLNRWFLKREKWAEADIRDRSKALGDVAVKIWAPLQE
jgi:hypothetical protein